MIALVLLVLGGFCVSCILLLVMLKYVGIITALAFTALFYFVSYTSALLSGVFWFAAVWYFGESYVLLVTAGTMLVFLGIMLYLSRYLYNKFKSFRFIKNY